MRKVAVSGIPASRLFSALTAVVYLNGLCPLAWNMKMPCLYPSCIPPEPELHMPPFTGLSAFPITPAAANGTVDLANLGRLLDRLVAANVDSIGLLGSTGTYAYLSHQERMRATAFAADQIGEACPLIVSIGTIRTDDARRLAEHAASAGAAGLLMAPVSYTPLTNDEVFAHYKAVAETTDLPLCIYDNPSTTHFTFSTDLFARLATIPNVKGVKTLVADEIEAHLGALRAMLPADFQIGYSGDWGCADALAAGADAWFSVVAGVLPQPGVALARAAMRGDLTEVSRINTLLRPLWDLFRQHGSLRVAYGIAHQRGLTGHDLPRPLLPLGKNDQAQIAKALVDLEQISPPAP